MTLNGLPPMQIGETKRINVLATHNIGTEPIDVTNDAQLASSNPVVARVNPDGSVTALKEGTARITSQYRQGPAAEYVLAVSDEAPLIDRFDFFGLPELSIGDTNQTEAFAHFYGVPQPVQMLDGVAYDSSQANVASIDANGLVTAHQQGTTVVRAVYGTLSSTYELTIEPGVPKLQRIELAGLHSMTVGHSLKGKELATYDNQTEPIEVTAGAAFKSGNGQVAAIDAHGVITALKVGVSVITATYEGKSAAVTLVVNAETEAPKRQLRAAWIASVENIDWPKKGVVTSSKQKKYYVNLINGLQASGMNAVVMQIKPTADAFYPSEYAPWSEWLTGVQGKDPGYDPLAFMIEEAHKRNMEFHAWFNPYRVSMKADPNRLVEDHPARLHPDWVVGYGGKLYFNPGIPEAKQFESGNREHSCERSSGDEVRTKSKPSSHRHRLQRQSHSACGRSGVRLR
nr:family 10 glycosylhydrolase [Paenibacillus apiarius]